ncbi:hypothetical protein LMG7143_04550 [Ralstonia thomasii]|nr:hypothetical protein LMG7143_04550 [Ralstonia sp. LMG 18095]
MHANFYITGGLMIANWPYLGMTPATLAREWERAGRDPTALILPAALPYVRRVADDDYTVIDWFKDQEEMKHGQSEAA